MKATPSLLLGIAATVLAVTMALPSATGQQPAPPPAPAAPLNEPAELITKRNEYHAQLQRAVSPIQANYVRSLQIMKDQMIRAGNLQGANAVEKEINIALANAGPGPFTGKEDQSRTAVPGVEILFVQYRTLDRSKTVDITSHIRQVLATGAETLHLTTRLGAGGKDPSMTEKKEMLFIYNLHGKGREKVFPEGHQMNFKRDLD